MGAEDDFRAVAAFDATADAYRTAVAAYHGHLRTIGLPPETVRERDSRADLRLRDLFVPLRLVPEGGGGAPEDLAAVLGRGGSAVVLGDPGAGKSTLLAYLALLFAHGAALAGVSVSRRAVPLFVSLRDLVRVQRDAPDLSFVAYLEAHARKHLQVPSADGGFFTVALATGEAVVLLDGLDEVGSEAARHRVAAAIRALHAQFPQCAFWVTSRIYGYTASVRLPGSAFEHYRVGSLEDAQVNDFIERWYGVQIPGDPAEREARAAALKEAVQRTPSVRRLAQNPLLLTLMAFIHHGLRKLPHDRGELYEKCVEMLLRTWQEARRESDAAAHDVADLRLHVQTQKDYLAHLALFAQEKKRSGADEEARGLLSRSEALDCLEARHFTEAERRRPGLTRAEAREEMGRFLEYVSDETGLLSDRGGDQLSFIHLSFQEYLAAWVFTCGSGTLQGPAFFEQHLGDPAWEEVLLLRLYIILRAPGGGGTAAFDAVISALLRKLEGGGAPEAWLTLTRALRDDLELRASDQREILRRAVGFWMGAPAFEGTWFRALEDVRLFSERSREALRGVLAEARAREPAAQALAALHLETQLFGFPAEAAEGLRARADLAAMLPDLVAFADEPALGALLAERATFGDWSRAIGALHGPAFYRKTLAWAMTPPARATVEAATGLLCGRIVDELRSREAFAARHRGSDAAALFRRNGSVIVSAHRSSATLPLSAFRSLGVELPRGDDRSDASTLCPGLSYQRLAKPGEGTPFAEFIRWAETLLSTQLVGCAPSVFYEPGVLTELAEGFVRYFIHDFRRYFDRDFSRDLRCYFGRDFSRDFIRDFNRDFGRAAGNYFVRTFVYYFPGDFGRTLGRTFIRDFGRDFGREFILRFGRALGIDVTHLGSEEDWEHAMEDEHNLLRLLPEPSFWRWVIPLETRTAIDLDRAAPSIDLALENPLALPSLFNNLWCAVAKNHLLAAFRHITRLDHEQPMAETGFKAWLRQHPADVYGAAFAWEEHAKTFAAARPALTGPEGALFLAHGAYACLMTGLEGQGPVWKGLLERRDPTDPLMQLSYLLYELCNFRDAQANVRALEAILAAAPAAVVPVLEAAGLRPTLP